MVRPVSGVTRRVHWGGVCSGRGGAVGEPGVVERHYRSLFMDGLLSEFPVGVLYPVELPCRTIDT